MPRINSTVNRRFDGKRVYTSNKLPVIPIGENDIYITTSESMRLDSLALKYYNDASLWWIIARANGIGMGYAVESGKQLRIPFSIERFI